MSKFTNIVISVIFCFILTFNPSIITASNNSASMETNNNTSAIATLKDPNTV